MSYLIWKEILYQDSVDSVSKELRLFPFTSSSLVYREIRSKKKIIIVYLEVEWVD